MFLLCPQTRPLSNLCARIYPQTSPAKAYRYCCSRRPVSTAFSSQPELKQYLILVPDHPDSLAIRRATREAHIKSATPLIDDGRLLYFGVMLSRHAVTAETRTKHGKDGISAASPEPEINGSLMVLHAASEEEARSFLSNDPYARRGVWNVASAQILPFKAG